MLLPDAYAFVSRDLYNLYAESFAGPDHLARIQQEARKIVDSALNASN